MKGAGAQPLGRLLVSSGLLSEEALEEVLELQKSDGRRLGALLTEKGFVRPHQLAQFLSHQLSCPWVSLQRVEITPEAVDVLPRSVALRHHMVPVHLRTTKGATTLYVAMDDPTDDVALKAAADASRLPVKPMVALSSEIQSYLDRLYGVRTRTSASPDPPPVAMVITPTRPPKPPPPKSNSGAPRGPSTPPKAVSAPPVAGASPSPPKAVSAPPVAGASPSPPKAVSAPPAPPKTMSAPPAGSVAQTMTAPPAASVAQTVSAPPGVSPPAPPVSPKAGSAPPAATSDKATSAPPNAGSTPPKVGSTPPKSTRAPSRPANAPLPDLRVESSMLTALDVIEIPPSARPTPVAKVLVLGEGGDAFTRFIEAVRGTAGKFGGDAIGALLADASPAVAEHGPCALVVEESTYENHRADLDRLALEAGALLIVSSEAFEGRHVEGLLAGAIKRWRRSSYEKGTILEGRYELLRDLGGAITGSRWEVRHVRTRRRAILKVGVRLLDFASGEPDESDAEAVRREHTALARVAHQGAVDLLDAGNTERGDPYVVLEMLEGRSLEGLVAARGALAPAEASTLVRQIADVLVAAHEAGVRHGDVRPENVLVVRDAWGIERAKLVHWEQSTPLESGGEADDLAGIGNCAFLALAGRSREGEGVRAVRSGRWGKQIIPPELAGVVARTLPGAGADRFASVRELGEALASTNWEAAATELLEAKPERRASIRPPVVDPDPEAPTPEIEELRRTPRAAYRTPVRVEVPGVGAVDGRSEDISAHGLFVVTRGKIAADARVTIRFALPIDGRIVSEAGIVRWSRTPNAGDSSAAARAIGIELTAPAAETIRQIERYVGFMSTEK